jgi:hypothetical protein
VTPAQLDTGRKSTAPRAGGDAAGPRGKSGLRRDPGLPRDTNDGESGHRLAVRLLEIYAIGAALD